MIWIITFFMTIHTWKFTMTHLSFCIDYVFVGFRLIYSAAKPSLQSWLCSWYCVIIKKVEYEENHISLTCECAAYSYNDEKNSSCIHNFSSRFLLTSFSLGMQQMLTPRWRDAASLSTSLLSSIYYICDVQDWTMIERKFKRVITMIS